MPPEHHFCSRCFGLELKRLNKRVATRVYCTYLKVDVRFKCPLRKRRNFCLGTKRAVHSDKSCHAWM